MSPDAARPAFWKRLLRWTLGAALAVFGVWLAGAGALLLLSLLWREAPAERLSGDAILCLGGDMSFGGWELPGPASARRAETCADLYLAGTAPIVLFTGRGHNVSSAAAAMARTAEARGVPRRVMILEEEARSTIQNAVFAADLLPPGTRNVVVVSDAFHLPRSWVLFRIFTDLRPALAPAHIESLTADLAPEARTTTRRHRSYLEWVGRESVTIWVNLARLGQYGLGRARGVDRATLIAQFD